MPQSSKTGKSKARSPQKAAIALQKKDEALKKSEQRFKNMANSLPQVAFETDLKGNLIFVNHNSYKTFGYTKKDFKEGLNVFQMLIPEDRQRAMVNMKKILLKKRNIPTEYIASRKDGTRFPVSIHSAPIIRSGKPDGLRGILIDMTKNKATEEELRTREAQYRELFNNLQSGVAVYRPLKDDKDFVFTSLNRAGEKIDHIKAKTIIGKRVSHVFPVIKSTALFEIFQRVSKTGIPEHMPPTFYKDNRIVGWRENYVYRLPSGAIVSVFDDITERKKTEIKLTERIKEFNVLNRVHSHMAMNYPLPKIFLSVANDIVQAFQFLSVARAQIVFDGHVYTSSSRKIDFVYKLEEPIVVDGLHRGTVSVGYFKHLPQMQSVPFWKEESKLVATTTQLLSRHIRNRETFERYQKIVRKSYTGIYISIEGVLCYANSRFFKIVKQSEQNTVGRRVRDFLVDPSGCHKLRASGLKSYRYTTYVKQKKGTLIDVEVLMQKIDFHGKDAILGRIYDISPMKKAENRLKNFNAELKKSVAEKTRYLKKANKRLQSLNELKDEFIAVTSHELRSPLTSIRGYLSFLVEQETLDSIPESIRQYLLRAYHHTESLNHLVNNILDVSRLDLGRFDLQLTKTDLIKLIKGIVDSLSFQAHEKRLEFDFQSLDSSASLMIKMDIIRISQVIRNLLDNAIKFSRRGQTIAVHVGKKGKFAFIKVIDHGVGIPKAKLEDIFEKFMQIKNVDTRYKGGAGLGLFIARRIIELHGGSIDVTSQKDKGATFTIKLPLN